MPPQIAFFDQDSVDDFGVTRPRGAPELYGWLLRRSSDEASLKYGIGLSRLWKAARHPVRVHRRVPESAEAKKLSIPVKSFTEVG
jgi:hypothetical protein